jgi:hypothetical protein
VHEELPGQSTGEGDATTSNIYQVGEMMFQFCQLDIIGVPDFQEYFTPKEEIKNWLFKGTTAGLELMRAPYSVALKKTVLECLYEDPELRPGLLDLKAKVRNGLRAAYEAQPGGESWENFFAPEPESITPNVVPPKTQKELLQEQEEVRAAERQAREEAAEDDELPRKRPPPGQIQPPPAGGSLFG